MPLEASTNTHGEAAFAVDQVTVVEHRVLPAARMHGEGSAEIVPVGGTGTVTVTEPLAGTQVTAPNRLKQVCRLYV